MGNSGRVMEQGERGFYSFWKKKRKKTILQIIFLGFASSFLKRKIGENSLFSIPKDNKETPLVPLPPKKKLSVYE